MSDQRPPLREYVVEVEATHRYLVRIDDEEPFTPEQAREQAVEALMCGDVHAVYEEIEGLVAREAWVPTEPCAGVERDPAAPIKAFCAQHLSSVPVGSDRCYRRQELDRLAGL